MSNLLCIEIPQDEPAGMIYVHLATGEALLIQNYEYSTFQFDLENNKYIEFDIVGYVKQVEPSTDEHGTLYILTDDGWMENIGIKTKLITFYHYI